MMDDRQLLRRYVEGSETAFADIVERYTNLVYSAAFRRTDGDVHRAQDVAQLVFTDLARKARRLPRDVALAGWLHRATQYAAAQLRRTEWRRHVREREAAVMNAENSGSGREWEELQPVLDAAIDELDRTDRDAVLLRFFEQRSLADVGQALGINEEAARKRVSRALEKLRSRLVRRGLTTGVMTLSSVMSVHMVQAAPIGLAAALASGALAGGVAGGGILATLVNVMSMTKLQTGVTALVVMGATTVFVIQQQSQTTLREQNRQLSEQLAQLENEHLQLERRLELSDLVARSVPMITVPPVAANPVRTSPSSTNWITRMVQGNAEPTISTEQAEAYLQEFGRTASSLLAAFRTTRDLRFLEEAKQKFPENAEVAFEALFRGDPSADERRQWLDVLKRLEPDNPLTAALSAGEYFRSGQTEQAIQDLLAASRGAAFQDYTLQRIQADEEAFQSAGFSPEEAKMAATWHLHLPHLAEFKRLNESVTALANSYRQAGDEASANAVLNLTIDLAQQFNGSQGGAGLALVTQLVGIAMERIALNAMNPTLPYGTSGQTVADRAAELTERRAALQELTRRAGQYHDQMTAQEWSNYNDRTRLFGEESAMLWLLAKYGGTAAPHGR
jgi:RNA polymerase sigma factor (sigma-70 family)